MRIVCPNCAATYEVPEAVAIAGTAMRCARCGETWTPVPRAEPEILPAEAPAGPAADALIVTPPSRHVDATPALRSLLTPPSPASRPVRRPPSVLAAWAASLAILVGITWAAIGHRQAVVHAWPPSARLYAALGFAQR